MKKTIFGMCAVAVLSPFVLGAENEEKTPKKEQSWAEKYNEAIHQQMEERKQAFNHDKIQRNPEALARFIATQRERIMKLEEERTRTR